MKPKPNPDYSKACIARIKKLAKKLYPKLTDIRHIKPRAYCIAKPAAGCAVFVTPPLDAEKHLQYLQNATASTASDFVRGNVYEVKVGDWCSLAYICKDDSQQDCVIEILKP